MRELIENFSIGPSVVNTEDNQQSPKAVVLMIERWNTFKKVAYTFNSHNMATAKQLYLALQKYKELLFAVGVKDHDENRMIQHAMREHMKKLCGENPATPLRTLFWITISKQCWTMASGTLSLIPSMKCPVSWGRGIIGNS